MAMASEHLKVLGNPYCDVHFLGVDDPKEKLPSTKFLMDFEAMIKHVRSCELEDEELMEYNSLSSVNKASIELAAYGYYMRGAIFDKLRDLQVPMDARSSMVDKILSQAFQMAVAHIPDASCKILRMAVAVSICVVDNDDDDDTEDDDETEDDNDDGIGYYEPRFVPASNLSLEKLERTRAEVSTICSICMEEILVGAEATRMPCSHLYYESCIVE